MNGPLNIKKGAFTLHIAVKTKVTKYVLGWRGKICKDMSDKEKGGSTNYWCT
jgi:hypothetical protein